MEELRTKRFTHEDEVILGTFDIGDLIGYSARMTKKYVLARSFSVDCNSSSFKEPSLLSWSTPISATLRPIKRYTLLKTQLKLKLV